MEYVIHVSLMEIGEKSFEILYISIANVRIIFRRKYGLVSKGAYILGTYIWEAYLYSGFYAICIREYL